MLSKVVEYVLCICACDKCVSKIGSEVCSVVV